MPDFTPTNNCPALPPHMNPKTTPKPLRELDNDQIDLHLQVMLSYPGTAELLPTTQYGRRIAVQMFLSKR